MPSKAQRAASRQARLSRRKRRNRPAPQNFQAGPTQPAVSNETDTATAGAVGVATRRQSAVAARRTTSAPVGRQRTARSRRRSAAAATPAVYRYLGRELRQIGIITTLIVALIAGLTFVLG